MCTLELLEGQARVAFQLFNKRFQRSWRYLSDSLGFDSNCALDLNEALPNFQKGQFWKEITKLDTCHKPKNSNLELPTLRFIHRFISATLFPRPETQTIREDELKILFAIVRRQKKFSRESNDISVVGCFRAYERRQNVHLWFFV